MASDGTTDPVCGKPVDALRARAVGIFGGVTYYFCSPECKAKFQDPRASAKPETPPPSVERRKPEVKPEPKSESASAPAPAPVPASEPDTIKEPARDRDLDHVPKKRSSWAVILLLLLLGGAVLVFLLRR